MLPHGFSARPPVVADFDDVAALVSETERADLSEPLATKEDIAAEWAQPNFDLSRDAVIVQTEERIIATAQTYRMRADVHIHSDFRGLGLGTWLLRWVEARGRAKDEPKTQQPVLDKDTRSADMLRSHGYTVGHVGWIFEIGFDERPAEPRLPNGIEIRAFVPGEDEHAVYQVVEDGFSAWPDRQSTPFEDWRASVLVRPDFDPSLLHVAVEGAEIVGVCLGLNYPDEGGWVQQLAVKASHRHRGIARGLLQRAFCATWDRGHRTCGLFTDSRTGARGLYERVGMGVRMTTTTFEKDL